MNVYCLISINWLNGKGSSVETIMQVFLKAVCRPFFLLAFVLLSCFSMGQEFELSGDYIIHEPKYELDSLYWATSYDKRQYIKFFVCPVSDSTQHIQELPVLELETYDGGRIRSLQDPKLPNVKEIVHVQLDFMACCVGVDNHYFLVTEDDEWIKLPVVHYVACDGPEPFEEYRFPSQEFGEENAILRTKSFPDSSFKVDSVAIIQRFVWNGKEVSSHWSDKPETR